MKENIERLHFLDAMRAILMMLGVVIHSAQIFNPTQSWMVYASINDDLMNHIINVIHAFRMPAFFLVSGYFCYLTLNKYGPEKFLKQRMVRLLVPFAFTAVLLNSAQTYILNLYGWQAFNISEYLSKGEYITHLWFLINLVVYFLIAVLSVKFLKPILLSTVKLIDLAFNKIPPVIIIGIMPLTLIFVASLNKVGKESHFTWINVVS